MFLFEATLSSVKAENGINVIFTSGVACPLEDERLSIVVTFFPPRHCKFETSLNQLKNESVSDKKRHDFAKLPFIKTEYMLILHVLLLLLNTEKN